MAFDVSWSSVDGYFRGPFPMGIKLSTVHNERAEPGAGSTSGFDLWNPYWYDSIGTITREDYSDMEGREIEQANALEYFYGTNLNNRKKVCEFRITDSSLAPTGGWVTLALMAFISGTNLTMSAYRIIYAQGGSIDSSNEISTQRTLPLSNVKTKAVAGQFARNSRLYVGIGYYSLGLGGAQASGDIYYITEENFITLFGGLPEPESEDPEFGPPSQPGGGYVPGGGSIPGGGTPKTPSFDNTSDRITVSPKPTKNPLITGFIHEYLMLDSDIAKMREALFIDFDWTTPDIPAALKNLTESLINAKRIDFILDFMILPVTPVTSNYVNVLCGGKPLEYIDIQQIESYVKGYEVDEPYVDFNCGTLSIDEYWVNFLDFTGTRVKLFLPYIGFVDIKPEYVIGGTLRVWYRFNTLDGSFMCYVESSSGYSELEESLIGQYAGVAAVHIPIQSEDYSNKVSGLISAIGTVSAASAGMVGAAAAIGAGGNLSNTLIQKNDSIHANGYNASSSFLSHRTPYLIIERQWSQFSEKYPEEIGIPSNVMCRLGDLYGLVKSENAHLDVIPASVEGKERISQLLADGIIL